MERGMLLLHRKPGTAIVIGDDVTVTVVRVEGVKVVIGVQAPPEVAVCRDDVAKGRAPGKVAEGRSDP